MGVATEADFFSPEKASGPNSETQILPDHPVEVSNGLPYTARLDLQPGHPDSMIQVQSTHPDAHGPSHGGVGPESSGGVGS